MSRVIVVEVKECAACPARLDRWTGRKFEAICSRERRIMDPWERETTFPAWCPLPESGEKEESDGRVR